MSEHSFREIISGEKKTPSENISLPGLTTLGNFFRQGIISENLVKNINKSRISQTTVYIILFQVDTVFSRNRKEHFR